MRTMPPMNQPLHQPLIECVPNFSEGRRQAVVVEIAAAITNTAGIALLDLHQDADYRGSPRIKEKIGHKA